MSVNKFKDSLKSKKTNLTSEETPNFKDNNKIISNDNSVVNSDNNKINDSNIINNTINPANNSVLKEVLDDIPEGQKIKKIVSFSLSPVVIHAIERISKERDIPKSKLVENILSKVLIEEK